MGQSLPKAKEQTLRLHCFFIVTMHGTFKLAHSFVFRVLRVVETVDVRALFSLRIQIEDLRHLISNYRFEM